MTSITITADQRRATTEALKIVRSKRTDGRPILRTLQVKDGHAFVTDSYALVVLPWADGLPDGCYDADDLYAALKGAGREAARITVDGDMATVSRFEPLHGIAAEDHPDDLGATLRGVYPVATVPGTPVSGYSIFEDAVTATEDDDYAPAVSAFHPDQLAGVLKCSPSYFRHNACPVTIRARELKPAVIVNDEPFAILMPMRTV
jgi:hypothetical protein